ncbi:MAG TPA: tRNA pseudouridine(55) synthase TruB [Dehalococcoidia bacterium]
MNAGFIIVNKPRGVTSFSMVALLRRITGVRRIGHAGTLDPLASGVLPIAVGTATRLIEYMDDAPKVYVAGIRFGIATDTFDADGDVTRAVDTSDLTRERVLDALAEFVGEIDQVPPLYSAIKLAGKPLYRYAREGTEVPLEPRRVRIDSIELTSFDGETAEIRVQCRKGTYIRSLAHDLGERLECGAHLAALVRTHSAGFSIEDAHTPDQLGALEAEGAFEHAMLAPDRAVERRPVAILAEDRVRAMVTGNDIIIEGGRGAAICRAYDLSGGFVGMLRESGSDLWHPEKVFITAQIAPDRAVFP